MRAIIIKHQDLMAIRQELWLIWKRYLGCEVFRRSTKGGCRFVAKEALLAKSKVGEDEVAFGVEEDVLRFQVTVDDADWVEVAQRRRHLGAVETRSCLAEVPLPLQVEKQLQQTNNLITINHTVLIWTPPNTSSTVMVTNGIIRKPKNSMKVWTSPPLT